MINCPWNSTYRQLSVNYPSTTPFPSHISQYYYWLTDWPAVPSILVLLDQAQITWSRLCNLRNTHSSAAALLFIYLARCYNCAQTVLLLNSPFISPCWLSWRRDGGRTVWSSSQSRGGHCKTSLQFRPTTTLTLNYSLWWFCAELSNLFTTYGQTHGCISVYRARI